jgi:hypothetical protein
VTSGGCRYFLVERYVPSIGSGTVESAVRRLNESREEGARHLLTFLLVDEETCLSVFEASDVRAVDTANERARFELERIVEVELFSGSDVVSAASLARDRTERR